MTYDYKADFEHKWITGGTFVLTVNTDHPRAVVPKVLQHQGTLDFVFDFVANGGQRTDWQPIVYDDCVTMTVDFSGLTEVITIPWDAVTDSYFEVEPPPVPPPHNHLRLVKG